MASQQVVMFDPSVSMPCCIDIITKSCNSTAIAELLSLTSSTFRELGFQQGQTLVLKETLSHTREQLTKSQDSESTTQALLHSALVSSSEATAKLQNEISALTAKIANGNTVEKKMFQKQLTRATEQLATAQESVASARGTSAMIGSSDKAKIALLEEETTKLKADLVESRRIQAEQAAYIAFIQGQQAVVFGNQQSWAESPQPVQPVQPVQSGNRKAFPCKNGFDCRGLKSGKCPYQHPSS